MIRPPAIVAHADWSVSERKRWVAVARLEGARYRVEVPAPVGPAGTLLARLRSEGTPVLAGFDFPIGLPGSYADRAGISDFVAFLRHNLGRDGWDAFTRVAERPGEISLRRPFYPRRPGGASHVHLCAALGIETIDELRRMCERATPSRRAACPLFWTLGPNQVGRAALAGWSEILVPALREVPCHTALWPFEGSLPGLLEARDVVVVETYPAEYYRLFGFTTGKGRQEARRAAAPAVLRALGRLGAATAPQLEAELRDGFGAGREGEDRFDAVAGLVGMLEVVVGGRDPGGPPPGPSPDVEGWILGQARPAVPQLDLPYARSVTPARFPDVDPAELERAATNTEVGTALLLENDRVRIWDITLEPGERTPFHCHRTSYFYRCESGGRWRLRTIEGEVILGEDEPGQVTYHALAPGERLVHELTNVGDAPLRYTTVELLG